MMRYTKHREPWGRFLDVKVNGPRVLIRQVKRFRVGRVFISSVCDGWQPLEEKYGVTRTCVEILLANGFPITILTKSALVSRDFDLIEGRPEVELGTTLTTLDERWRRLLEPRASSSVERISFLKQAKEKGITTYAFLGPIMPYFFDAQENLKALMGTFRDVGVDWIYVDLLNPRPGVWASLYPVLRDHCPQLVPRYKEVLFNPRMRGDYGVRLRERIEGLGRLYRLEKKLQFLW